MRKQASKLAVVARHNRPKKHARGSEKHAREKFGRRFLGAFLLVEVEKAGGVGDDGEATGKEMVAFAGVHLTDEKSICDLFETSSVPLQFVTVGGGGGQGGGVHSVFPTVADSVVLRVSILDLKIDRWMVLSERFLGKENGTENEKQREQYPRLCRLAFLSQHVNFAVWCSVVPPEVPPTVQVIPRVVFDDGTSKHKPAFLETQTRLQQLSSRLVALFGNLFDGRECRRRGKGARR